MSPDENRLERRAAQRFDFQLPVAVRFPGLNLEGCALTQNLSGRGTLFYTDLPAAEGEAVELTLVMPAEISLTENLRVRCRGRVTRVQAVQGKLGVAVQLEEYEYLPDLAGAPQVASAAAQVPAIPGTAAVEKAPLLGSAAAATSGGRS